jgi:hypothetical protein
MAEVSNFLILVFVLLRKKMPGPRCIEGNKLKLNADGTKTIDSCYASGNP